MHWYTSIDLYCERIDPSFWAEPLNAISNASFVIASLFGLNIACKLQKNNIADMMLCILAASIGIGSFLFHTFANLWSSLADVLPIWTFVALSITTCISRLSKRPKYIVGIINALIFLVIILAILFSGSATQTSPSYDIFNGSTQYLPALLALWFFAINSKRKKIHSYPLILGAAITFTLSLIARSVDLHLCSTFPLGTHYLWHILNGVMVAFILKIVIQLPPATLKT